MAKTSVFHSSVDLPAPKPARLLAWYVKHARDLPWREHNGRAPSPYHTWISEIMLQQTTVATVISYYLRFIKRWPTVKTLAQASNEDVMKEWAGLGYYSRARNLHACAKTIAADYNGVFPDTIAELKELPGIGDYTANAIRAIAFDKPANVVDGNVERVMARVFAFDKPLNEPKNKKLIREIAAKVAPQKDVGAYAQALMDLGATICTPKNPKCTICPWNKNCLAFATGQTQNLPIIIRKKSVPTRYTVAFLITNKKGQVFLRRRSDKGLLGGLWELPSSDWRPDQEWSEKEIKALPHFAALKAKPIEKDILHVFTHFRLITRLFVSTSETTAKKIDPSGEWFTLDALPAIATLTKKALQAAKTLGET